MFTARIQNKTIEQGVLTINIIFSDGNISRTESCVPQNEDGFIFWVKGRLDTLNASSTLAQKYADGSVVSFSTPVVEEPTQEETDRSNWIALQKKLDYIKSQLTDVVKESEILALEAQVKADFKTEYLDFIV